MRLVLIAGLSAIALSASVPTIAQTAAHPALYAEIARMDSVIFTAFNTRDQETMKTLFTADLEFYHDKAGVSNYAENMASIADLFGQPDNDLRRELVKDSLEVFPIKNYGAIQLGAHTFCHTENGEPDCGTFRFVHVWKKVDGAWKIARVISFDH